MQCEQLQRNSLNSSSRVLNDLKKQLLLFGNTCCHPAGVQLMSVTIKTVIDPRTEKGKRHPPALLEKEIG